ncbi:MAG: 50S ribosomal protein L3 [Nitrospirota bacterium]|nr:50S ribosomal protein L3 [Nitrospirota bacterium]
MSGLIGSKLGMTQVFDAEGRIVPVTVVDVGPCVVTQKKTMERDGYEAVQLGFGAAKEKHLDRPRIGHLKAAGTKLMRTLREFRGAWDVNVGDEVGASLFEGGQKVDVTGTTVGKGFAGTIKRHGFTSGPRSHGSMNVRAPGSIGQCAWPSRVFKNKKLPGHLGDVRRTVQALKVFQVLPEENLLLIKGAVPGPVGGLVIIRPSVKG